MLNIRLQYLTLTKRMKRVFIGLTFIQKTNLFLFDSLGLEGFKFFIVDNDQHIINELLYNFKRCKSSKLTQKLKLCIMEICVDTWQKMSQKKKRPTNRNCTKFFSFT